MKPENNPGQGRQPILWFLEQLVFPQKCMKCRTYRTAEDIRAHTLDACFCEQCMGNGLYPIEPPFCHACGISFPSGMDEPQVCKTCLKTPLKLGQVRAVAEYKGIMADGIQLLKYHSALSVAKAFEQLLFQAFVHYFETIRIDLIMPMPLHRARMRKRGFNQAYILSRNFKKFYHERFKSLPLWDMDTDSLIRIKKTQPQTGFDIEKRKGNVKNAFKIVCKDRIHQKHILLIDDVFTTGATCNEAATQLLDQGAASVNALVLARA